MLEMHTLAVENIEQYPQLKLSFGKNGLSFLNASYS
jgi:hypothetical protein